MKKISVNVVLFIVAVLLLATVGAFGVMYTFLHSILKVHKSTILHYWGDLLYQINVGIDQIGNVLLARFLNDFAIRDYTVYPFGKVNMTISHVLSVNEANGNLKKLGRFIVYVLEYIDPGHMQKYRVL